MRAELIGLLAITSVCVAQMATVSGVVTDAWTRLPLQGAFISATGGRNVTRTDIEGRYSLAVEPAADVQISARRTGYFAAAPALAPFDLRAGESVLHNVELRPMLKIAGVVRDYDTGDPIPGCHVFALRRIYSAGLAWHVPAGLITADTRGGQFEIRNLESGDYVLEIVPDDVTRIRALSEKSVPSAKFHGWSYYPDASRVDMAAPITVSEAGDASVNIRLRKREPRTISGTLTTPASLELIREVGEETRRVASGTLSAAGPFRIDNAVEGDYRLVAVTPNGMRVDVPLTIGDRDVTDLKVSPRPGGVITGTVVMDNADVPLPAKLRFGITVSHPIRLIASEKLADIVDGRFEIAVEAGEYRPRIVGLPTGYALIEPQESPLIVDGSAPKLRYFVTNKPGQVAGDIQGHEIILLPGMAHLTGSFAVALAPGKYKVIRLEGDETLLVGDREFLQAKSALAETIEVKSGETTTLR